MIDMDERKNMGNPKDGVVIPIAPSLSEIPDSYIDMRDTIISKIKESRIRFAIQVNTGMIELYWDIGSEILRRQKNEGWGAKVIDRLSKDLKDTFPDMSGFSPRNLGNMKKFAACWSDFSILQRTVAKIPWRSNIVLMNKLKDEETRRWYADRLLDNGWSMETLDLMIGTRLIERQGKAVNNFDTALPFPDSDMARDIFKDPYLFDYIGTGDHRRELEIERSLTRHIEKFLLELGQGFAFVGRQVHLELGGDDFYIDLLFYHLKLRCYVVIELKACEFEPGFVGQLNLYQNVVNDVLRHPDDKPTIGLLLVKGKNKTVVEYSLSGFRNPISVADWQERLTKELPEDLKSSLPTIEEIERELDSDDGKPREERPRTRKQGSAYALVVLIGLALFLVVSGAAAVSAHGRRVTARYAGVSGQYDLAVSLNERAFLSLTRELRENRDALFAAVSASALQQIEDRLIYRGGRFYVEERHIPRLFRQEAEKVLAAYIAADWQRSAQAYERAWNAQITVTDTAAVPVSDAFAAVTSLQTRPEGYTVHTFIQKSGGGVPGYARVEGVIAWPRRSDPPEEFVPARYAWRVMPPHFSRDILAGGLDAYLDDDLRAALGLHAEANLRILAPDESPPSGAAPALYLHPGPSVTLDGTVRGIVIAYGDVTVTGTVHGAVWAEGAVLIEGGAVIPDADALFSIALSPAAQRDVYDFLRLTRFAEATLPTIDIAWVLGALRFAETDGAAHGALVFKTLDDYAPTLTASKQVEE